MISTEVKICLCLTRMLRAGTSVCVLSSLQDKANMHFHKLFLDVPTEEPLRQSKF